MADANLSIDELEKGLKIREKSVALEEKMLEAMELQGKRTKGMAAQRRKVAALQKELNKGQSEFLKAEIELEKLGKSRASQMKVLSMIGGGLKATLQKMQDLTKRFSDNTRASADAMGINVNEAKKMNTEILGAISGEKKFQTTMADVVNQQKALKDAFGGSTKFTAEQAVNLDIASKKLGISVDQSAKFAKAMFSIDGASLKTSTQLMAGTKALAQASGVSFDAVMEDIANSGESFAGSMGLSGKEMMKAAVAARRMGFELSDMKDMSEALLDIEGGIEAQMKFNMLTGKNINLDKARALALEGDHAGMLEEAVKQAGNLDDLNQLEIKALNEALGVDIMKLKNAEALAAKKEEEGIKAAEIQATEQLIMDNQLAAFEQDLIRDEAAQTAEERKENFENNMLDKQAEMIGNMDEQNNLALILQGIQLVISGVMAAQAISSSLKAATEKDSLRSAIAAIPKLVAAAASRAAAAVSALVTNAAATFGIGTVIALAAAGAGAAWLYSNIASAKQTGDLGIDPNGGPVVMSPKEGGLFQGTKNDGVSMSPSHGKSGGGGGMNIEPLIRKMDELIQAVKSGRVISVDGYQLNEAIHLEKTPAGV